MKTVKVLFLVVLVLIVFQQIGHAEIYCKIKGRVIDKETRNGVPDVSVNAHRFEHDNPKDYFVMTDANGNFEFSNLRAGRYKLCYDPLYPYAIIPDQEHLRLDWENSFLIGKGEVKFIEQELLKGGSIILQPNLPGGDISQYGWRIFYLTRIEGTKIIRNISTIATNFRNPRFQQAPDGFKISGLIPGDYIISRSLKKKPEYYSGEDVEYAGLVKMFNLAELEEKELVLDYTSASKVIFNIKDRDGNKFHQGTIYIYKEIKLNNKAGFYPVWEYSYRRNEEVKPILMEPGKYYICFYFGGELIGSEGNIIEFESNDFLVNIEEGKSKALNLVISIDEKLFTEIDIILNRSN